MTDLLLTQATGQELNLRVWSVANLATIAIDTTWTQECLLKLRSSPSAAAFNGDKEDVQVHSTDNRIMVSLANGMRSEWPAATYQADRLYSWLARFQSFCEHFFSFFCVQFRVHSVARTPPNYRINSSRFDCFRFSIRHSRFCCCPFYNIRRTNSNWPWQRYSADGVQLSFNSFTVASEAMSTRQSAGKWNIVYQSLHRKRNGGRLWWVGRTLANDTIDDR